jgi:hypothetical protein
VPRAIETGEAHGARTSKLTVESRLKFARERWSAPSLLVRAHPLAVDEPKRMDIDAHFRTHDAIAPARVASKTSPGRSITLG